MGAELTRETFTEQDYARFRERLERCLSDLGELLGRPGFGAGPATIGAELEVCLVDDAARPLPRNQAVLDLAADPRITLELNRYNLELNASPVPLAGRPFTALAGELGPLLDRAGDAARAQHGRIALIGILPTLGPAHLDLGMVTDAARYRALDRGLRRLHRGPFRIRIAGAEPLELTSRARHGRGSEHLVPASPAGRPGRVHPGLQRGSAGDRPGAGRGRQLTHVPRPEALGGDQDRAVQAVGRGPRPAPARGVARRARRSARAGCGAARWSCSPRASGGTSRCSPSSATRPAGCGVPPLDELRLHQGTVWRWNRAIYDPTAGGHLRIEMRALPAGPTVTDMLANAAFLIGLTLWLAGRDERWTYAVPFERAEHGFYRAAQHGLAAELSWPADRGDGVRTVPAAELVPELLPAARQGLLEAGVAAAEADRLLGVIGARVASGQTGAAWQRAALAAAESGRGRDQALAVMLDRYLSRAATGQPVHTWPA